ncbi:MAG: hypothetical protein IJE07_08675 [Clostridia bacterium]|nr:hypothetical protein [Clostridia bacterium]
MKELVFLPDRDGRDEIGDASGFVRLGGPENSLGQLAQRLTAPATAEDAPADALVWRSALTLALLSDARSGLRMDVLTIREDTSPFASFVLAAQPEARRGQPVHLLVLEKDGQRRLLGVADAATGVRLPAQRATLADVVDARCRWIDRETGEISDPVPCLNEAERTLLLRRMEALKLQTPAAQAFADALRDADAPETGAVTLQEESALLRLALRTEAVCGLSGFDALTVQEEPCNPGENALLRCLGVTEAPQAEKTCRTYLWNGVPFARTSAALGLTEAKCPGEAAALEAILAELTVMSGSSVRWNQRSAQAMRAWLDAPEHADMLPQARERLESSCAVLAENGRQVQSTVTLTWPWNAQSCSVRALLQEALGDGWLDAAAAPFSDRLTKLTAHVLGDTTLHAVCACADGVLLPPLSQKMAACVARVGVEGGLAMDALRFRPMEDGGMEASFLLRGTGEMRMVRAYSPEEIAVLEEAEVPEVAVWPCMPMPGWKAYYVFATGDVEIAATDGTQWRTLPALAEGAQVRGWRTLAAGAYPGCITLHRDGLCLGTLPNLLPEMHVERVGSVLAGIDMGSSQTATAFALDGVPTLLDGPDLLRRLCSRQELVDDAFLSGLKPRSVVPTAAVLTGPGEALFTDGYAFHAGSLQTLADLDPAQLRARLKWRSDADSVRARRILLHQVMLGAAMTAAMAGAKSISWRVTIADEMGDEGREAMLSAAEALAQEVAGETGLPLTEGVPAVAWAEESAALCACLRGESVIRSSGVSLDMGSGSIKMHLWMMNQSRPVAGEVVFEGVQDELLALYRQQPVRLLEDLADCADERLHADVMALVEQLNPDLNGPRQGDKLALMLDMLLDVHRTAVGQHIAARNAANRPTWLQSLLLEKTAGALFCVGLMLAQAGENAMNSHMLPQDMTVCLTGRGAWLLDTLPPMSRNALQHLTHLPLRLEHPVRFITIRPAAQPVQSIALGLTVMRETGQVADAPLIRTRESFSALMARMMQHLSAAFPAQMWLLHDGLYDWQSGTLTPAGQDSIRRAAASVYDDGEELAATVQAFLQTLRKNPILTDAMLETGA